MSGAIAKCLSLVERLSERDRMAVLAAVVASVVGLDMLLVSPMNAQRKALVESMAATAQGEQQVQLDAQQQQANLALELDQRKAKVDKDLAAFGLNNTLKDSLSFMLARTLRTKFATIESLRALNVDELVIDAPTNEATDAVAEAAGSPAEDKHPTLYRHRYELKLQTELKSMAPTLDALENDSRPMRVESVHMLALPSGAIEVTVVLVTIGLEKTWLAL